MGLAEAHSRPRTATEPSEPRGVFVRLRGVMATQESNPPMPPLLLHGGCIEFAGLKSAFLSPSKNVNSARGRVTVIDRVGVGVGDRIKAQFRVGQRTLGESFDANVVYFEGGVAGLAVDFAEQALDALVALASLKQSIKVRRPDLQMPGRMRRHPSRPFGKGRFASYRRLPMNSSQESRLRFFRCSETCSSRGKSADSRLSQAALTGSSNSVSRQPLSTLRSWTQIPLSRKA